MKLLRAALAAIGTVYDILIPPKIASRVPESRGDCPEAVSARISAFAAPASGHPGVATLGLSERDRLWLLGGVPPAAGLTAYYGWCDDSWCWSTDGMEWKPSHAQRGDRLPAPSGEFWIEVVGWPFEWPFETSAAAPPAAVDDPAGTPPPAGSPVDDWTAIPRGYIDDEAATFDDFDWVRWVIPAITSVLRNHIPMQLSPDGPILCARADSSPCAESCDWDDWVAHVAPNVAVRIHSAAAEQPAPARCKHCAQPVELRTDFAYIEGRGEQRVGIYLHRATGSHACAVVSGVRRTYASLEQ